MTTHINEKEITRRLLAELREQLDQVHSCIGVQVAHAEGKLRIEPQHYMDTTTVEQLLKLGHEHLAGSLELVEQIEERLH